MTDAEISRRLALAIGYAKKDVRCRRTWLCEVRREYSKGRHLWALFDYRHSSVIWPIAERFDCFPQRWDWEGEKKWTSLCPEMIYSVYADTAAKAVALAVIKAKEQE